MNSVEFAKALSDETRQKIMAACCCKWLNVSEIVEAVGNVSQPTISHHLAVLKEAGLVNIRTEGKHTFYSLNQDRMAFCCGQLIQIFAPESLQAESVKNFDKKE